jgi:hypothetical protein
MNQKIAKLVFTTSFGIALAGLFSSCNFSQPPAIPSDHTVPTYILKFVPYTHNDTLIGYMTFGDQATNQVASAGLLRLTVHSTARLSVDSGNGSSSTGMKMKTIFYDNTFSIGVTNFHWETTGTFFKVQDLEFSFAIPYSNFRIPVQRGKIVDIDVQFQPTGTTNSLTARRTTVLY